jgi:hypothetical protein
MSTGPKLSERRVVMSHNVARRCLFDTSLPEFRFRIFTSNVKIASLQSQFLKHFRNGRKKIGSVEKIGDLGVKHDGDTVHVWSRNRKALIQLKDHYEKMGFETTGVW